MCAVTALRRIYTHFYHLSHSCVGVAGNAFASISKPAEREASRRPPLIEAPDSHMSALAASNKVIQISNLRKEFTSSGDKSAARVAVDGVDLTMYEVRPPDMCHGDVVGASTLQSPLQSRMCKLPL